MGKIKNKQIPHTSMVSFDLKLFASIPVIETIDIILDRV